MGDESTRKLAIILDKMAVIPKRDMQSSNNLKKKHQFGRERPSRIWHKRINEATLYNHYLGS